MPDLARLPSFPGRIILLTWVTLPEVEHVRLPDFAPERNVREYVQECDYEPGSLIIRPPLPPYQAEANPLGEDFATASAQMPEALDNNEELRLEYDYGEFEYFTVRCLHNFLIVIG